MCDISARLFLVNINKNFAFCMRNVVSEARVKQSVQIGVYSLYEWTDAYQ